MSTNLYFSFIVPVYNRKEELGELLSTISNQDFKEPFEVIIVDDGSTDRSKDVADSFTDMLELSYYFKEKFNNLYSSIIFATLIVIAISFFFTWL